MWFLISSSYFLKIYRVGRKICKCRLCITGRDLNLHLPVSCQWQTDGVLWLHSWQVEGAKCKLARLQRRLEPYVEHPSAVANLH